MKASSLLFLLLMVAGCASPRQPESLTSDEATQLAIQLANQKAANFYHCQPFHDGQPATFVTGRWRWHQLCTGDYDAEVELLADGSPNRVVVNWLSPIDPIP